MPAAVRTVPEDELAVGAGLVIGLGGDGTILRALKLATEHGVPVLGVNLGRLAFLAEVNLDELPEALDRIDRDEHWLEERAVMTVSGTCFPMKFSAFNDSALSRVPGNGPAALAVEVEGEVFARYTADALVIATPTGSTAYSFAAGGPIVSPRHRGLLVTPVAPHAAFDRACFLHPDEDLRVHVLDRSAPLLLEADGQRVAELQRRRLHPVHDLRRPGAHPAPAAAGLLRARAAQAAAHGLLRARPALNDPETRSRGPARVRRAYRVWSREKQPRAGAAGAACADERPAPHRPRAGRGRHRPAPPVVAAAAARRARGGADRPLRPARAGLRLHAPDRGPDRRVPAAVERDRRAARGRRRVRAAALRRGDAAEVAAARARARPRRRGAGARAPRAARDAAAADQGRRRRGADHGALRRLRRPRHRRRLRRPARARAALHARTSSRRSGACSSPPASTR